MVFKFVVLAAVVACASAGHLAVPSFTYASAPALSAGPLAYAAAPVAKAVIAKTIDTEYDPHPQYSYAYDVADSITGDSKSQQETRDGDVVHGSYSLVDADGTRRVVHYTADDHNGFNAVVHKEPAAVAVKAVAPVVAKFHEAHPISYAATAPVIKSFAPAPAVSYTSGPTLAYSSPVLKTYAAAPAVAYSAPAFETYAESAPVVKAVSPVVKTVGSVAYPSPYAYSYANQYSRSYSAPILTKYTAAPGYAYSSPLAYGAAIPVAHSPVHAAYAATKW